MKCLIFITESPDVIKICSIKGQWSESRPKRQKRICYAGVVTFPGRLWRGVWEWNDSQGCQNDAPRNTYTLPKVHCQFVNEISLSIIACSFQPSAPMPWPFFPNLRKTMAVVWSHCLAFFPVLVSLPLCVIFHSEQDGYPPFVAVDLLLKFQSGDCSGNAFVFWMRSYYPCHSLCPPYLISSTLSPFSCKRGTIAGGPHVRHNKWFTLCKLLLKECGAR